MVLSSGRTTHFSCRLLGPLLCPVLPSLRGSDPLSALSLWPLASCAASPAGPRALCALLASELLLGPFLLCLPTLFPRTAFPAASPRQHSLPPAQQNHSQTRFCSSCSLPAAPWGAPLETPPPLPVPAPALAEVGPSHTPGSPSQGIISRGPGFTQDLPVLPPSLYGPWLCPLSFVLFLACQTQDWQVSLRPLRVNFSFTPACFSDSHFSLLALGTSFPFLQAQP